MRAGNLDRRVTLQRNTPTQDAAGGTIDSWTDIATVWGSKLDLLGKEFLVAGQDNAEITTKFQMRYRDDLTPAERLVCQGVIYDIRSVAEIGRQDGLEIMAAARQ